MAQSKPWERNWQGDAPARGTVISDPYRGADEARKEEDQRFERQRLQFERERTRIAQEDADRRSRSADVQDERTASGKRETAFAQSKGLRDQFDALPSVRAYTKALPVYASGLSSASTSAGDLNLINAYAKIMDPDSVVREGEAATVAGGDTLFGQIKARLSKELEQEGQFRPEYRNALRQEMRVRMGALNQAFIADRVKYKGIAREAGADPMLVVGEHPGKVYQGQEGRAFNKTIGELDYYGNPLASEDDDKAVVGVTPTSIADYAAGVGKPQVQPDGRVIVREADGTQSEYPDQAAYAQAKAGEGLQANVTDNSPAAIDARRDTIGGELDAIARGVSDTASLGLSNPLNAGLNAFLNGTSFADEWANEKATIRADERVNPWLRFGGQIAGGLASGYGLARGGAAALPNRPLLGTALAETGGGAVYGGSTGNDPLLDAVKGASVALAGNQVGQRVLGPLVDRAVARFNGQADPVVRQIAVNGGDTDFGRVSALLADAQRLNVPMALADADPGLRALAGSATRIAPAGREYAERVIAPRGRGQAERAIAAVERDFAPPVNMIEARNGYVQQARTNSRGHYEQAFARPAPVDAEIDAMLQTPGGQRALAQAVAIAQNEGRDPLALGFDLNDLGEVVTVRNPSFETLHFVKRGLDSVVEGSRGANGVLNREDPLIAALDNLRGRFRGRLGDMDDNYRAGNAAYAEQMRNRDALNYGYDATRPSVSPDGLVDALTRFPADPMRQGYSTGVVEQIERMRLSGNPYEAVYGSPAQMEKAATLFSEGAANFARQAELEQQLARTQYETLGGSPTASRQQADAQFGPGIMGEMLIDMATGQAPLGTVGRIARGAADRYRMGVQGPERGRLIAEMLLAPDPEQAATAVAQILARQAIRDRSLGAGAVVGSGLALPMAGGE